MELDKDLRSRQETRELLAAAQTAFEELKRFDQAKLDRIVDAVADAGEKNAAQLAKLAVAETGFGNEADKTEKTASPLGGCSRRSAECAPSVSCGRTRSGKFGTSACPSA